MTEVDAAQLKVTVKQILQVVAFLITAGFAVSAGIWSAVTWKTSMDNQMNNMQQEIHLQGATFEKEMQLEDDKLLWIMENMQRRKDAPPFRLGSGPSMETEPMKGHPQSNNVLPDLSMTPDKQESTNSPGYTNAMQ